MKTKLLHQLSTAIGTPLVPVRRGLHALADMQNRERIRLAAEFAQTRGLMPLLMKQRNGYRWTEDDRKTIREDIAALKHISRYLILLMAPGGFFAMPVLAWWLDRRRDKRPDSAKLPSDAGVARQAVAGPMDEIAVEIKENRNV